MDFENKITRREVDQTGLESCRMADFGIGSVEASGSGTGRFVSFHLYIKF